MKTQSDSYDTVFGQREETGAQIRSDPRVRVVLDLFEQCDRIDAMPDNPKRVEALKSLLRRVEAFEAEVHAADNRAVLDEATALAL